MSLISTLTSSSPGASLTSTTSSAIALSQILTGSAIAIGTLFFVLVLDYTMSPRDSWNADTATALWAISAPLIVTFFAFVVYNALHLL